jgi:hypothetical protein
MITRLKTRGLRGRGAMLWFDRKIKFSHDRLVNHEKPAKWYADRLFDFYEPV